MNIKYSFILFFIASLIFITGCDNSAPAGVSGTVRFEGQPLAGATVTFIPVDDSRSSVGTTNTNGKYELRFSASMKGAVVGEHQVEIRTAPTEIDRESKEKIIEHLPEKYNNKTELKVTLKSGNQTIDFDLQP
ncbi:MAG: carboxypeptidase-like regulatory domain-containing protein [Planctomycetaceae bacterium]|jgi:hypothetical protein|nr:carboxypeptidase-like regulatory domain-containing protein [Planctomycetaceae bacterium]